MIRYFNNSLVLTSENPSGFINFSYESGDSSIWFIIPRVDTSLGEKKVYVNGLDINGGTDPSALLYDPSINFALIVNYSGDPSIASFVVSSFQLADFDYNLILDIYDTSTISNSTIPFESVEVSIYNRRNIISDIDINLFETTNIQTEGDTSYLVLRTNPKFTGNIKLISDSENRLYLDTFKISDELSNKKYRHQLVSGNSFLSGDIRRVFEKLPLGELYRLNDENVLNISLPQTTFNDQYYLNYCYGARLFLDELYPEDYSILAPLWLNNDVPSYFAVFRIPGVFNPETYDGSSLAELANEYITDGKLLKTWSLKQASPLGTYMRNHIQEIQQFRSSVFLSLTDPAQSDFDPNTWHGVAVDKGIMTGRSEVPYFFNQKAGNFTDMNAFLSEGFERNNLLLPNLVNLEYAFNDTDVSLYTMHRYFGLYLTENELYRVSYYADVSGGPVSIISLDGRDSSSFFNSNIFDASGNVEPQYRNRIFGINDTLTFKRFTNNSEANGDDYENIKEWVNKPGDNLFSTDVEKKQFNSFVSLKINNLLKAGEHLRIINKAQNKIWEVYGSNWDILNAGESMTYASVYESPNYPTLYRCMFSTKGDIGDQITAIDSAFDVFSDYVGTPFRTGIIKSNSLSLLINDDSANEEFHFQRITSSISYMCGSTSTFNSSSTPNDITFFGRFTPTIENIEVISCDSSFGPINFELFGDRQSIMFNMIDPSGYHIYSLDASLGYRFQDNVMYLSADDLWYRLIQYMDISVNESMANSYNYVDDPAEIDNNIIILSENPIKLVNGNQWNAYGVYPLSISLMGINPVKDFDFTVYDSSLGFESEYWYAREDDPSTYQFKILSGNQFGIDSRNSYEVISGTGSIYINGDSSTYSSGFKFNTFFGDASITASSNTIISYNVLDGSASFLSYVPGSSEEDLNDYYWDPFVKSSLRYSLTVPTVTKWVGLGSDARGNDLRLILNGEIFEGSTNFIPFNGQFEDEISYPVFKYLDSGDRAWESYVYFDINDSVAYDVDGSTYYKTLKQFMFDNPTVDVFSKIVYSNKNVPGTYVRSSSVFYNQYKDTIEGIITGLNLSFKIEAFARYILDAKDWNRYRFSFISTPSRNETTNSPLEVIINESTETVLIIWYQGNDLLNYTYRNSNYLGGKGLLDAGSTNIKWQGFVDGDPNYSHIKAPFYVNTSTLSTGFTNVFGTSTSGYPSDICTPFAQLNFNGVDGIGSIFNAYEYNHVTPGGAFLFDAQYNTFKQYVNYEFAPSASSIGPLVINQSWNYMSNDNYYRDKTTDLHTLKYILNNNNVQYYILRGEEIISNRSFGRAPISISIIDPRLYKPVDSSMGIYTYLGWYHPKFNNILNFNGNEDDNLIGIVNKDFTLGNTYFRSYEDIPQYWFNKVVTSVTAQDVSAANAIKYLENYNVFKAQWDAEYYTLSSNSGDTLINGYNATLELPSFFGSKLVNLPNQLGLDVWDITTASFEDGRNWNSLVFNLTRNIINTFKSNEVFLANWSDLIISDNIIDGYIKETIISYYNITRPKIGVNIYTKPYDGRRLYFELDSTFELSETKNVDGDLNFINGDYVYSIKTTLLPDLSYYISFLLTEK